MAFFTPAGERSQPPSLGVAFVRRAFGRSVGFSRQKPRKNLPLSLSGSLGRSVFLGQGLVKTSLPHSRLVSRLHFLLGQALAKKCRLLPRSRLALSATMLGWLAWLAKPASSLPVFVGTSIPTILCILMTVN